MNPALRIARDTPVVASADEATQSDKLQDLHQSSYHMRTRLVRTNSRRILASWEREPP